MQRFKSHKVVYGARIIEVGTASSAEYGYLLLQGHSERVRMSFAWWARHSPEPGGFLVCYEDGYASFSPAKPFEEGYHLIDDAEWPLHAAWTQLLESPTPLVPEAPRGQKPPTEVAIVTHVRCASFEQPCSSQRPLGGRVTMYELRFDRFPALQLESADQRLAGRVPEVGDRLMRADDGEERILPPAPAVLSSDTSPRVQALLLVELPTRVTSQALEAMIASITYEIRADGRTTVCELTFHNGFSLRGESSAACVENFKQALGEELALKEAMDKAWGYAGFMLREDRYRAGLK